MNAITVSVEYHDYLEETLRQNARNFEHTLVVTSHNDRKTPEIVRKVKKASCFPTHAFYRKGAEFNKGAAIEEALDYLGRDGWFAVVDADTLLPEDATFGAAQPGQLYLAQRRLCYTLDAWHQRPDWEAWPVSEECLYLGGYFQLFHASDPVLAQRPWYPTHWRHAGRPATEFIEKWDPANRRYFPWQVIHIGPPRENWFGRATRYPNGELPREATPRIRRMAQLDQDRAHCGTAKERTG